jgi:hypothetical protein
VDAPRRRHGGAKEAPRKKAPKHAREIARKPSIGHGKIGHPHASRALDTTPTQRPVEVVSSLGGQMSGQWRVGNSEEKEKGKERNQKSVN